DALEVGLTLDDAVSERVVGVDPPVEQLGVEPAELVAVLAHDLEMDDWLSHLSSPSRHGLALVGVVVSSRAHVRADRRADRRDLGDGLLRPAGRLDAPRRAAMRAKDPSNPAGVMPSSTRRGAAQVGVGVSDAAWGERNL